MDFSKLKLDLYDIFGILIPGFVVVVDVGVAAVGWSQMSKILATLPGNLVVVVVLVSYVLGHLVQEAGDFFVQVATRDRYLKRSRDEFWVSDDGKVVQAALEKDAGKFSVDSAYNYCLSRSIQIFAKRETFVAISDLAPSWC